jgi:hypothetical protein
MFTSLPPCLCKLKVRKKGEAFEVRCNGTPFSESGKDFIPYFLFYEGKQTCDLFMSAIGLAVDVYSEFTQFDSRPGYCLS